METGSKERDVIKRHAAGHGVLAAADFPHHDFHNMCTAQVFTCVRAPQEHAKAAIKNQAQAAEVG